MGQQYLAAALLHVFEGLHVQAFDLPTLLSDSTRSPEAAVIQLFTEVKRHKPSVIYIPNIHLWSQTVGPVVISTFMGLLRTVPPSDPVLLLGILESQDEDVDEALLKKMFGFSKKNFFDLPAPGREARREFFAKIIEFVKTPPKGFPNPDRRKLRQLEELEVAPPPPKPEITFTKEELKAQKRKDYHTLNLLKIRIQPIMDQVKKYKRFRSGVIDEASIQYLWEEEDPNIVTSDLPPDEQNTFRPYEKAHDKHGVLGLRETATGKFFYNLEIVTIEKRLSNGYYKRPSDFVADIKRMVKDNRQTGDHERTLRSNELLSNVEVDIAGIVAADPVFMAECEQVYLRELEREKGAVERAQRAQEKLIVQERAREGEAAPPLPEPHTPRQDDSEANIADHIADSFPANGDNDNKPISRPITPTYQPSISYVNGHHHVGDSEVNGLGFHAASASNGTYGEAEGDGDGDIFMSNSEDHSGNKDTQGSSFGPSAQPKPPYSYTAPSQKIRRESGLSSFSQRGPMTPMAPGSQPADYTNEASTTQTTSDKKSSGHQFTPQHSTHSLHASKIEYPDLTLYPDRAPQEEHLPDTQQSQPSPRPRDSLASHADTQENSGLNGSQSQSKPQPPLFDAPNIPSNAPTNLESIIQEEPHEPFVLDLAVVERLHEQLILSTSGFSVEQLEQVNTSLMDHVWQMREEWNRTLVADGLGKTYNEVLEDMQAMQEIGAISQATKDILANLSFQ